MGRNKKHKSNYDPEVRRKKQIELMRSAQIALAEFEAAEKNLQRILDESHKFGINIDDRGEVVPTTTFTNKSWDTLNVMGISLVLTGGLRNITRDNIPKRYAIEFFRIRTNHERTLKNIFAQRHSKTMRERKKELIKERKRKLRTKEAAV